MRLVDAVANLNAMNDLRCSDSFWWRENKVASCCSALSFDGLRAGRSDSTSGGHKSSSSSKGTDSLRLTHTAAIDMRASVYE